MHWLICLTLVLWVVELAQSYVTKEIEISLPQKSLLEKDVGWYCIAENVDFNQEVYAVSFKGKADYNEIGVMKLMACTTEQSRDSLWACDNPCKGEQGTEIYTWSQDTPPLVLPKNVGFRFGGGEFKHLVLKAELKTTSFEAYSPASISILVTNMHQKFVAGVHRMQINNARGGRSECLYNGVPIIPYAYKTTSGSATKVWRIRDGEKSLLEHSSTQTYKMIDERTVVHKSDILGISCASDSTQAVKENNCGLYLQYYRVNSALPTTSLTNCFTNKSTTGETSEPLVTSTTKTTTSTITSTDKKNSTNNKGQKVAVTLSQTDLLESMTVAPTKTSSLTLPPSIHTQQEEPLPRFDTDWYLPSRTLLSLGNVVGVEVTRQHVVLLQQGSRQLTPSLFDKDNKFIGDRTAISENVITVLNKFDGSIERSYGSNMFQFPFGISVDDKLNVWVTDIALHQVIKLSSTGTPIFRLGEQWSPGNDDKHFCQPTDVVVALDSTFYVADGFCNSRVVKVSADGQLIKTFASSDNPLSLSLDSHRDELYVAYRHSIDVFRDSQRVRSLKRSLSTASALYWIAYSSVQDGVLYTVNRGRDVIGNTIDSNDGHVLNSWSIQGIGKATGLAVSTNEQAVYVTSEDQRKLLKFHVPDDELSPVMEGYINAYVSSPESLVSDFSLVATNKELLAAIDPGASPPRPKHYSFQITYVNFPQKFFKKQIRLNKDSMQRIDNGEVSFLIEFATKEERKAAQFISVKVKRTQENIDSTRRLGEVFIQSQLSCVQDTKVLVKLNLDSVYEQNGQRVYELDKSLNEGQKRFHLKVEVHFANKQVVIQNTHCFTVAGKRRKPTVGDKRGYSDSSCSDNSVYFSPSSGFYSSDNVNADKCSVIACGKLVADHIKTKTITLDTMNIGETITTSHGDIAYSFPLEDKDDVFEEGEVVGFKLNREGKYTLMKLTALNSMEVELHGVITRSFYLQAKVPLDGSRVETVCMMGIIPVQVVGAVKAGDTLHASQEHPGKVEARHGNGKLIGYAFADYTPSKEDLEHKGLGMVQAGVSVLDCASKALQNVRLNELKEDFEVKFESESKRSKRSRKCIYTCMALSTFMLILLGVLLYQYFMPGSAMRTAICEMGSEDGTCEYNYIPFSNIYDYPRVNGVEFTFENLMKKMSYNYNRLDQPGVRYFMNIDRCSYGQLKRTTDIALALKRVYGPPVFAVDQRCYHAYKYNEPNGTWKKYNSVDWEKRKNILCHPRSKWKGLMNARMED